jgi:hypothetical protein
MTNSKEKDLEAWAVSKIVWVLDLMSLDAPSIEIQG